LDHAPSDQRVVALVVGRRLTTVASTTVALV